MVKIFRPDAGTDNLGATLSQLGQTMFGDQTGAELKRQQLYAMQRQNTEMDNLMRSIGTGAGAQAMSSDPRVQAALMGSGYSPKDFGQIGLLGAATQFGAKDPRTQNFQIGTGQDYGNTYDAFSTKAAETARANDLASQDRRYGIDQNNARQMQQWNTMSADQAAKNAETQRQFNLKPVAALGPNGEPTFAPQGEAAGGAYSPVMSESDRKGTLLGSEWNNLTDLTPEQRQVLGANAASKGGGQIKNYIVGKTPYLTTDGMTDLQGNPLPPGGYIGNVVGGPANLTPTDRKAILEADQNVQRGKMAVSGLERALSLTDQANAGIGAKERAYLANNLPDWLVPDFVSSPESAKSTLELDNTITQQALDSLRQIFGGNPTEGERAVLLEMQGSSSMPREARRNILQRARDMAAQRLEFNRKLANDLRNGDYYTPGTSPATDGATTLSGAPAVPGAQAVPSAAGAAGAIDDAVAQARQAIQRGAPRDEVVRRLRQMGINPEGM